MKAKQSVKVCIDIAMTLGLLFLMGYHLWGDTAHEWVGAGIFVLFILHHILNWRWWAGLFKGKYSAVRILQVVIDLLTLAAMLGLMVSAVILSNNVFAFLHIRGHMSFARRLHMAAAYWGFLLMAAHLGASFGDAAQNDTNYQALRQTPVGTSNASRRTDRRLWHIRNSKAGFSHLPLFTGGVRLSGFQRIESSLLPGLCGHHGSIYFPVPFCGKAVEET